MSTSYTVQSFLDALVYRMKTADQSKSAYRSVSFPSLRHIHLNWIDLAETSLLVDTLMDCLKERYERYIEVQVLRLDDCYNISQYNIERLSKKLLLMLFEIE